MDNEAVFENEEQEVQGQGITFDQEQETEPSSEEKGEIKEETPPPKKSLNHFQKRIHRMASRADEAEKRAQELEQEVNRLKQQTSTPAKSHNELPKLEDFDSEQDYVIALVEYKATEKAKELIQSTREKDESERLSTQAKKAFDDFRGRAAVYATTNPDLEKACEANLPISNVLSHAIIGVEGKDTSGNDLGVKLYHYLNRNPGLLSQLNDSDPEKVYYEIGKLTSVLKSKYVKKGQPSMAPKPGTNVGDFSASFSGKDNKDEFDTAAYNARFYGNN